MATAEDIDRATDPKTDWVAEHVQKYVQSGGTEGHEWNGVPTLVLATTGKKSGEPRRTGLIYGVAGDEVVIVASKGGAPEDPKWYENLLAEPHAGLLVGTDKYTAVARTANDDEYQKLWDQMAQIWPQYDDYKKKTDRQIPIVLLRRES